jgi:hypothetical protein
MLLDVRGAMAMSHAYPREATTEKRKTARAPRTPGIGRIPKNTGGRVFAGCCFAALSSRGVRVPSFGER